MESGKLIEIKNRLAMLPGLIDRREKLQSKIYDAEIDVKDLLSRLEAETLDVEQLKKDSFSAFLFKLTGRYEGKLDKESQEALAAKNEYDKATEWVKNLKAEYFELGRKITELRNDEELYKTELVKREEAIQQNTTGEVYDEYKRIEGECEEFSKQLVETDEAISAANSVRATCESALDSLESAEDWATYDVWGKGGILSHMAKYDNIDDAQECFNRLSYQLKDLQAELKDVNLLDISDITIIDSTTRTFDFWFDNIFTDLSVRNKIREDIDMVNSLDSHMGDIIDTLKENRLEITKRLRELEMQKNELLLKG